MNNCQCEPCRKSRDKKELEKLRIENQQLRNALRVVAFGHGDDGNCRPGCGSQCGWEQMKAEEYCTEFGIFRPVNDTTQ